MRSFSSNWQQETHQTQHKLPFLCQPMYLFVNRPFCLLFRRRQRRFRLDPHPSQLIIILPFERQTREDWRFTTAKNRTPPINHPAQSKLRSCRKFVQISSDFGMVECPNVIICVTTENKYKWTHDYKYISNNNDNNNSNNNNYKLLIKKLSQVLMKIHVDTRTPLHEPTEFRQ